MCKKFFSVKRRKNKMVKKVKQLFTDTCSDRLLPNGKNLVPVVVTDNFDEVGKEQFVQVVLMALRVAKPSTFIHNQVLTSIRN